MAGGGLKGAARPHHRPGASAWRQENPGTFTSYYSMLFVKTAKGWRADYQLPEAVEGTVVVKCTITHEGRVRDCRVTQSLPFMEAAILDALHAHRYKPATVQGRPVDLPYTFTIQLVLPEYLRTSKPRP